MTMATRLLARGKTQLLSGLPPSILSVNTRQISGTGEMHNTMVYSFGDGSFGALGLPFAGDAYEPTKVEGLSGHVSSVAAGHYHSLAVTQVGEVWAWGRNEEGQLGRGLGVSRESWNQPMKVVGLDKVNVRNVAASGVVSMAIDKDGALWAWGKSKRGQLGLGKGIMEALVPQRIEALVGQEVVQVHSGCLIYGKQVALGWGHALARTKEGKLYGWGYSADGRLGSSVESVEPKLQKQSNSSSNAEYPVSISSRLEVAEKLVLEDMEKEKNLPINWEPCPVHDLNCFRVVDIACGLDHALVLFDSGLLFSCGDNTYGQLGRSSRGPHLQPLNLDQTVIAVAAGLGHSLAIALDQPPYPLDEKSGNFSNYNKGELNTCVFSWGWNSTFQLGRTGEKDTSTPGKIIGLDGKSVVAASGGRAHSLAITSKRELYVWGCGRNGRLGLGSSMDEPEPSLVESLGDFTILQAVCGFDHNLLLVAA